MQALAHDTQVSPDIRSKACHRLGHVLYKRIPYCHLHLLLGIRQTLKGTANVLS